MKKKTKKFMKFIGRLGGTKTAELYGKKHFSAIGKKGAEITWAKKERNIIVTAQII